MSWMEIPLWGEQANINEILSTYRPSPAEFPELPSASKSYWIRNYAIPEEQQWADQSIPTNVDIAIIGSGITGAAAAYRFSQSRPDLRIALLEARGVCSGATGRNGGHLVRAEVFDLRELAKIFGAEDALRIRMIMLRNRDMVLEAIAALDAASKVDLRLDGSLNVFGSTDERDGFVKDVAFAKEHGHVSEGFVMEADQIADTFPVSKEAARFGGAFIEKSGTFYPRKFVAMLLRAALSRMPNLSVHPFTPVSSVTQQSGSDLPSYSVVTSKGTIDARCVLHATNAYVGHLVPEMRERNGVFGCRAHMFGINPNVKTHGSALEIGLGYANCFHWLLQRPNNGPFLYGYAEGERINYYNDTEPHDTVSNGLRSTMHKFLNTTFPTLFTGDLDAATEYDWTGIQGFTLNGASIVGRPSAERQGEFVAVGYNGEGMGKCFACATVVVEGMLNYLDGQKGWNPPEWFPRAWSRNCNL